jgi:parallel beta-helix repeat protein
MPVRFRPAVIAIAALATLAFAPSAFAKTYVPHKLNDHAPDGKCNKADCTLREAVIAANARPGTDKIMLTGGKTFNLSLAGTGESAAATGDLDITGPLEIRSASHKKVATINAQGIDRVFDVNPLGVAGVQATFRLLAIRGGNAGAVGTGGGIQAASSTVKIARSTVRGNQAFAGGGLELIGAQATISQSTFNDNIANGASGNGGAIDLGGISTLSAVNSTIANNVATDSGGGIELGAASTATISSLTVARNLANSDNAGADQGGGLHRQGGASFTVRNSIIAQNTVGTGGTDPDCSATGTGFTSQGVNLVQDVTGCTGLNVAPNLTGVDPKLGLLAKNGGPTKTLALFKSSPAINAAGSPSPKRDQRGVKRKNPDIGAFERVKKKKS